MPPSGPLKGRGALSNPPNRFDRLHVVADPALDAGPGGTADGPEPAPATEYLVDRSRSVISRNDSPDIPFDVSLNPYRGCEHGCVYCYARPTHEYLGFSLGLDFETRIVAKPDAARLLREALARRSWAPRPLALSGVTDAYQPVERTLGITRQCLEVLAACRHPVTVVTKGALVVRDLDLLAELARADAVSVAISVTTLDEGVRRALEPRAPTTDARLDAVARLAGAGVPAGVMVAPIVPGLTDHDVPRLLARAAQAGASFAGYTMLRLPHGLGPLFEAWLDRHCPDRKARVLARIRDVRDGRLNDARFGARMRGEGVFADLTARLFATARERAGIPAGWPALSARAFRRPGAQPTLFEGDDFVEE